jgi:hypothetical protein
MTRVTRISCNAIRATRSVKKVTHVVETLTVRHRIPSHIKRAIPCLVFPLAISPCGQKPPYRFDVTTSSSLKLTILQSYVYAQK